MSGLFRVEIYIHFIPYQHTEICGLSSHPASECGHTARCFMITLHPSSLALVLVLSTEAFNSVTLYVAYHDTSHLSALYLAWNERMVMSAHHLRESIVHAAFSKDCRACAQNAAKYLHIGCLCDTCGRFVAASSCKAKRVETHTFLKSLQQSTANVLGVVLGCAPHLAPLRHLGLHSMALTLPSIMLLGQLLSSLSLNVTELTLTGVLGEMKHADTVLLFKAIALMRGL